MRFNGDGTVEDITNVKASAPSVVKPVLDQVKEKAAEVVEAVDEAIRPMAKRGRKKTSSD